MILIRGNVEREIADDDIRTIKKLEKEGFRAVGDVPAETNTVSLDEMSAKELKEHAKDLGIDGYSALKKDELIEVLKQEGVNSDGSDGESGETA